MEPQENCYFERKCCKRKNCFTIVIAILAILFFGVIGAIIGAALSETILAALAAVIVLAIVLGVLLIISLIYKICKKEKNCC